MPRDNSLDSDLANEILERSISREVDKIRALNNITPIIKTKCVECGENIDEILSTTRKKYNLDCLYCRDCLIHH